jgi:hypothetical protein
MSGFGRKVAIRSTVAASLPYRLKNQEPIKNLAPSAAASPPDVRRGFAPPSSPACEWAVPLVRALPYVLGQRPNRGRSPNLMKFFTARHSLASHPAAKPQRGEPSSMIGVGFKAIS